MVRCDYFKRVTSFKEDVVRGLKLFSKWHLISDRKTKTLALSRPALVVDIYLRIDHFLPRITISPFENHYNNNTMCTEK